MSGLRGTLEGISLTDVTQLLNLNRKTGRLHVEGREGEGTLWFSNGEVVHAESPQGRGETAAFEILAWTSGHFEFQNTLPPAVASIRRPVPSLLMDSARVQDSRRRLGALFPDLHAVPWARRSAAELAPALRLSREDLRIVPFFDGYRDFQDVMGATDQHDVTVRQAAAVLLEAGELELLHPAVELGLHSGRQGLLWKAKQFQVPQSLRSAWTALGPYAGGVQRVRVLAPGVDTLVPVVFLPSLEPGTALAPREFMEDLHLAEGALVTVRPAP